MIRLLAQIIFHQVCASRERILEQSESLPVRRPVIEQIPHVSDAGPSTPVVPSHLQGLGTDAQVEPSAQGLVVLFTQLAQRHVQAARAQEEIHEYNSHHYGPPRADGVRLRTAIHPVASE